MTQPFNVGDTVCLIERPEKTAKVLGFRKRGLRVIWLDRPIDGFCYWQASDLKHAPHQDQDQ